MASVTSNEMQTVIFSLGQEEYGIDIARVQEIIRLPEVTVLPGTADYIPGIINLRGSIIPIIDMKKKFRFSTSAKTDETRVIVFEIGSKRVGLIVDQVSEVIKVPSEVMVAADTIGFGIQAEFLLGVARFDERLLILLNVDKIVD